MWAKSCADRRGREDEEGERRQRKRTGVVAEGESGVKDDDGDDDVDDGRRWRPCHREHRRDVRDETVVAVVGGDYNAVKGDLVRVEPMRGRRHHRRDKDERCDPKPRLEEAQETLRFKEMGVAY